MKEYPIEILACTSSRGVKHYSAPRFKIFVQLMLLISLSALIVTSVLLVGCRKSKGEKVYSLDNSASPIALIDQGELSNVKDFDVIKLPNDIGNE